MLGPNDVESLLLTLMPERSAEALRSGAATEWICGFEDLGRVRCLSFRDHRGPGGVFRIMPTRAVTDRAARRARAKSRHWPARPKAWCSSPARGSSGKRTLMSAFVDQMNRTRHVHIITIEREINIVHERASSFVSQREVHGSDDDVLTRCGARCARIPTSWCSRTCAPPSSMKLALEAAARRTPGDLRILRRTAPPAPSTASSICAPPEHRRQVQLALAQNLRGVVAQVLLKKTGGGRLAARELLLNTPAVAGLLAEGKTSQLPLAIEGGRKHGMVPLNDALGGFVQSGAVDVREAYRRSVDRPGLLALLQRQGVDTSQVERLA